MSYVVHTLHHAGGDAFVVLGPEDAVSVPAPDSPAAYAEVSIGWAYATGKRPAVLSNNVNTSAHGTRMVLHTIPVNGSPVERVRVILLDGAAVDVTVTGSAATRT